VAGSVDGLGAQQQRVGKCQQVMCLPEHVDRNWCIETWEIELLDSQSGLLGMLLLDALMPIQNPTNSKFALFHLDKLWQEACHILMV